MELEKGLQTLQEIKAPEGLKKRIHGMAADLPPKHRGLYFPLVAFQMAIVAVVLFVLIGLGSGVVVAAKGSHPGSPLYPVRQIIEKVPAPFVRPTVTATPTPVRPSATPTVTPNEEKKSNEGKEKEQEKKVNSYEKKDVKGISTQTAVTEKQYKKTSRVEKFFRKFFHKDNSSKQNK